MNWSVSIVIYLQDAMTGGYDAARPRVVIRSVHDVRPRLRREVGADECK